MLGDGRELWQRPSLANNSRKDADKGTYYHNFDPIAENPVSNMVLLVSETHLIFERENVL